MGGQRNKRDTETIKKKVQTKCMCVCVSERSNTGGKHVRSGLPVEGVVMKEAIAAALLLSVPFITSM